MKRYLNCSSEFEARFVRPAKGPVMIAGSKVFPGRTDRRQQHVHAIGVDMQAGDGVDVVADLEERDDLGPFAHIECLSVLEHSRRPWLLAANLEHMLQPGGTLFVSAPFSWRVHAYPDDYWRFTASGIQALFRRIKWIKMRYGAQKLSEHPSGTSVDGWPHFARQEVFGFGKRC